MDNEISQIYNPEEEHVPIPIRILEFYLVEGPKDHGWSAERESPKHVFNQRPYLVQIEQFQLRSDQDDGVEYPQIVLISDHLIKQNEVNQQKALTVKHRPFFDKVKIEEVHEEESWEVPEDSPPQGTV